MHRACSYICRLYFRSKVESGRNICRYTCPDEHNFLTEVRSKMCNRAHRMLNGFVHEQYFTAFEKGSFNSFDLTHIIMQNEKHTSTEYIH